MTTGAGMPLSYPGDVAEIVDDGIGTTLETLVVEVRSIPRRNDGYRHFLRADSFPTGWTVGDTVRVNAGHELELVPKE